MNEALPTYDHTVDIGAVNPQPEITLNGTLEPVPGVETLEAPSREVAAVIAESARELFDRHVETTVAEVGGRVQEHVKPTINKVVSAAKDTVAATKALQEQSDALRQQNERTYLLSETVGGQLESVEFLARQAADRITTKANDVEAALTERISEVDTALTQRVDAVEKTLGQQIGETEGRLTAQVTEVKELVRTAEEHRAALQGASQEEILAALRALKASDNPADNRLAQQLESSAQPTHVHLPLLEAGIQAGVPIWLHGEAGSGKSTGARQAAERQNLDFRFVQTNPTTTESKLMGFIDAGGTYRHTGLREIVEEGGVFLFDEIDNGTPAALTTANSLLANGHGEFPDRLVKIHPETRFVAAANTIGKGGDAQYVGRNRIDAATIDRFAFVPWDGDRGLTRAVVLGGPSKTPPIDISEGGIPTRAEWLDIAEAAGDAVKEKGIQHLVTSRASIYGAKLAEVGVGVKWLAEMLIFKGMKATERQKIEHKLGNTQGW